VIVTAVLDKEKKKGGNINHLIFQAFFNVPEAVFESF